MVPLHDRSQGANMATFKNITIRPGMVFSKDRYLNFLNASKGLSAYQTAKVMTSVGTRSMDWRGMGKKEMAAAYAYGVENGEQISERVIQALSSEKRHVIRKLGTSKERG